MYAVPLPKGTQAPARAISQRKLFSACLLLLLGCSIGYGVASYSGSDDEHPVPQECIAHFDLPRPVFELEAKPEPPVTVTVEVPGPPAAPSPMRSASPQLAQVPLVPLNGAPTRAFRDNLKADERYVTSWPGSGFTNDVILYMNLVYMAMITERIPVIPFFTPTHVGGNAPTIAFGEVFDVPRLQNATGKQILEWHQVKDPASDVVDTMGCWSVWMGVSSAHKSERFNSATTRLNLDVSYTPAPSWIQMLPDVPEDFFASFWSLATLAYPTQRNLNLRTPTASKLTGISLPPDEQMLCYDYLYYLGAYTVHEWTTDYSPAWRFVGQHMHWNPELAKIAEKYTRETLTLAAQEPTPPFIVVHVRHGDFAGWCKDVPVRDCFAPLSAYERRVEEVQKELWDTQKIVADRVIVTSDEQNATWWDEVSDLGWYRPDHSRTAELHGAWYPILIDAVIQSSAAGFVGTEYSTVSITSAKRVEAWNHGATRAVRWGRRGADDH